LSFYHRGSPSRTAQVCSPPRGSKTPHPLIHMTVVSTNVDRFLWGRLFEPQSLSVRITVELSFRSTVILAQFLRLSSLRCRRFDDVELCRNVYILHRETMTQFLYSHLCQLLWPPWCEARKCKHFKSC